MLALRSFSAERVFAVAHGKPMHEASAHLFDRSCKSADMICRSLIPYFDGF